MSALDLGDVEWPRDRILTALLVVDCQHQADRGTEIFSKELTRGQAFEFSVLGLAGVGQKL